MSIRYHLNINIELLNTVESYLINSALSMNDEDLQELYHTLVLFDYKWHKNSVAKVRKTLLVSLPDIKTESNQDDIDMLKQAVFHRNYDVFFAIIRNLWTYPLKQRADILLEKNFMDNKTLMETLFTIALQESLPEDIFEFLEQDEVDILSYLSEGKNLTIRNLETGASKHIHLGDSSGDKDSPSPDRPKISKQQLWILTIYESKFSHLPSILQDISEEERKLYWEESIDAELTCLKYVLTAATDSDIPSLQTEMKREIESFSIQEKISLCKWALFGQNFHTIYRLISIWGRENVLKVLQDNASDFLYQCLSYGSLNILEYLLSLNIDFKKDKPCFIRVVRSCIPHGLIGLDMLKFLFHHSLIHPPQRGRMLYEQWAKLFILYNYHAE